jgi:hypothetical protein
MANNTYQTSWNTILNALTKADRGAYKCTYIAQVERSKVGTNSYRVLHTYTGSVSPVQGHPWSTSATIYFSGNSTLSPTPDGTTTIFTIPNSAVVDGSLIISYNGLVLNPDKDYTISDQTITMSFAPSASMILSAFYIYSVETIAGYYVEAPTGTIDGSNVTFTTSESARPSTSLRTFLNGLLLVPITDYTYSGTTITSNITIPSGELLLCEYRTVNAEEGGYTFVDYEIPSGTINGSNTTFTLVNAPSPTDYTQIFYRGELLTLGDDYSLSDSTITFNFAPITGSYLYAFYVHE